VIEWSAQDDRVAGEVVLGRELDDAEGWVRSWNAQASSHTDAAALLADRVAGISAQATGLDDAIAVTVGSTGAVTDLHLTEAVEALPAARLAEEILRVMRAAQANLSTQVATAVDETVGGDSETGRAVLDSFASRFPQPRTEAVIEAPEEPVMPTPPFPRFPAHSSFPTRPSFPHQPNRGSHHPVQERRGPRA
jgi:hypothetical protein